MVEMIKPGSCPALPEGFEAAHAQDEASTHSDDSSRFLKKDEYLALFKKMRAATIAALDKFTNADLDKPTQGKMAQFAPTAGDMFLLVSNHEVLL